MKYKISISELALFALTASLALRICLSNPLLDYIYPYSIEGGSSLQKIHPGTWIALVCVALITLASDPIKFINTQIKRKQRAITTACVMLSIVMVYNAYRYGPSGLAYLIDTYLYAYICLILLSYLSHEHINRLSKLLGFMLATNCALAITEYVMQSTLLPNPIQFGFFRSNALLGHPLNNALIIATFGIAALGLNFKTGTKTAIWLLTLLGLLAFSARAATGIFLAASIVYLVSKAGSTDNSYKLANRAVLYTATAAVCAGVASYLIFYTTLGASIAERLVFDQSAEARLVVFKVFQGLNYNDIISGLGAQQTVNLFQLYLEGTHVENFWVFTLIQFGLISFALIYLPLGKVIFNKTSRKVPISIILPIAFILISSSNNSLAVKTPALAIFLILIILIHIHNTSEIKNSKSFQR